MKTRTHTATETRRWNTAVLGLTLGLLMPALALAQQGSLEALHLSEPGPENSELAQRARVWDVVETVGATPDAPAKVNRLVAERRMVGPFLQEIIRPALGSDVVLRMDYLSFHRGEGRYKYVSMDTRAPVGIMSAASFGRGEPGRIEVTFEPLSVPATGQLLQMNQVFVLQDANHDRKEQRFVTADGKGTATEHQYAYTRRE